MTPFDWMSSRERDLFVLLFLGLVTLGVVTNPEPWSAIDKVIRCGFILLAGWFGWRLLDQ